MTLEQQPKRGRGRPRKDQAATAPETKPTKLSRKTEEVELVDAAPAPKKRGRKPKAETAAVVEAAVVTTEEPEKKRGRGRPRREEAPKEKVVADPEENFDNFADFEADEDFDDFSDDTEAEDKASSFDEDDDVSFDDNFDLYGDTRNDNLVDVVVEKEIVPYTEREIVRVESNIDQKSYASTAKSLEALNIKPYVFEEGEEYMNKRQLQHIKDIIIATKENLLKQLDETKEAWREEKGNYADEVDQADHESDFAITLRNRDRERRLILKLDKTLTRIENDPDFGYCDKCGDEIGMRRLEARPTAELCINCKSKSEIHERQQKG